MQPTDTPAALPNRRAAAAGDAGGRGPAAACTAALLAALAGPAPAQPSPAWSDDALRLAPAGLLPARLPVAGGEGWRLRAAAAAFDAADAVAVRDFSGSWDGYSPRAGRNAAIEMLQAEVSASRRHWEVALVARSEIVIDGSRGAWDAVRADKQRQAPPAGSRLDADAAGRGIGWVGLRGARSWSFGSPPDGAQRGPDSALPSTGRWRLSLAATLLSVRRVQTLAASGRVDFDGSRYAFDAAGTRRDSYREFAGYGTPRTLGIGIGADLGLAWQPTAGSFVNLSVVDALSALRIDGVATQDAAVSSSTATTGADGYVDYRPLLSGRYSAQTLRTSLPRKFSLNGGLAFDPPWGGRSALAGLRIEQLSGLTLPAAWAVLPLDGGVSLQLDAETRFRSLGVGLAGRYGGVFLRTRTLPVGSSRTLGWQLALNLPL